jgi:hypothetical protein
VLKTKHPTFRKSEKVKENLENTHAYPTIEKRKKKKEKKNQIHFSQIRSSLRAYTVGPATQVTVSEMLACHVANS